MNFGAEQAFQLLGTLPIETSLQEGSTLLVHHVANSIDGNAPISEILEKLMQVQSNTNSGLATNSFKGLGTGPIPSLIDNSGTYTDYSEVYGFWDADGGIDWAGSNSNSDGPAPSTNDAPKVEHMPGSIAKTDGSNGHVNVYFAGTTSDGLTGDQLITQKLVEVSNEILAATPGVNFVNVSATTNGVHSTTSDHYSGNAIDINQINGDSVRSAAGKAAALQLEAQALADPNTRYVEGPGGNWVRGSVGAQWEPSKILPTSDNHVHWSTFRH